ncbi:MAG: hypothetical protein JO247_05130 [Chloroflexi bacterium]|nr:hypothetical protein [Chloroflexota bacterium]
MPALLLRPELPVPLVEPVLEPVVEPLVLEPEMPLQGATVAEVAEVLFCEISTPATLQFNGTFCSMISTKLIGPPALDVVLVLAFEAAERMSRKTTASPAVLMLRKLPVIGTDAPLVELAPLDDVAAPTALALAVVPVAAELEMPVVEPVVEVEAAPIPVKNEPLHWLCPMDCW